METQMAKMPKSNTSLQGEAIKLAASLALTYVFASLALDSASMWMYLFTFVALWLAFNALKNIIGTVANGGNKVR